MTDPTPDTEPTPKHFGGSDEPVEDEYAKHAREQAEKEKESDDELAEDQ